MLINYYSVAVLEERSREPLYDLQVFIYFYNVSRYLFELYSDLHDTTTTECSYIFA